MSAIKFETEKSLNVGGMKMISVKTNEGKQLFVKTDKCFSFGVKKDKRFKTVSMSLVLDENIYDKNFKRHRFAMRKPFGSSVN